MPTDSHRLGAPKDEIEITPEMIEAGGDCLDEFTRPGGLTNTVTYVAEEVYRAMESRRCEILKLPPYDR